MPKRLSVSLSDDQAEFLERIKRRHGMAKSQYVSSLIKAEMEKEEDRLRPILSVKTATPQLRSHEGAFRDAESGLISPLPPVPIGASFDDLEKIVSVNSEVKALIRDGKIKKTRPWKPPRKSLKATV